MTIIYIVFYLIIGIFVSNWKVNIEKNKYHGDEIILGEYLLNIIFWPITILFNVKM